MMKSQLLRNVVLPFGDLLFGQKMIKKLKHMEIIQWWDEEKIRVEQSRDLGTLLNLAYDEVPFYRDLMRTSRVKLEMDAPFEALKKIPVVTKTMLRQHYPLRTVRQTGQRTYEASTSGSTGTNFYVAEDAQTAGWYRATFLLELEWSGWKIGDGHLQTGMTLKRSIDRRLKDMILGCNYYSAYNLNDENLARILAIIEDRKLRFLFGYPGSLFQIAKYARKVGWNLPLKASVTWGDVLQPNYRSEIETAFSTKVFDTYGCGEGIQIASQCEFGNYHIFSSDVVLEIVDDYGNPVKRGEIGNIAVTRLHPGPMPLIRYSIGDMGSLSNDGVCPCGRGFPILESLIGRSADFIETPSGNRLLVHFFTGVLEHFHVIDTFQVIQESKDEIILKILTTRCFDPGEEDKIIEALKTKGCADMRITIDRVEKIELLPSGKHKFIISKVKDA